MARIEIRRLPNQLFILLLNHTRNIQPEISFDLSDVLLREHFGMQAALGLAAANPASSTFVVS